MVAFTGICVVRICTTGTSATRCSKGTSELVLAWIQVLHNDKGQAAVRRHSLERNCSSASSPPAEAPIPTMASGFVCAATRDTGLC
jgi:hypothetical protein